MASNKKAWAVIHSLIADGLLAEKESWDLVKALFDKEVIQIPVPIPTLESDNPEPEPSKEVKGFINNFNKKTE